VRAVEAGKQLGRPEIDPVDTCCHVGLWRYFPGKCFSTKSRISASVEFAVLLAMLIYGRAFLESMSVDLVHPALEKVTLVLEGIGDGKVRVNSSSLDHPLVIPPDQALEIVAIEKITIRPRSCVSLLAQP